MRTHALVSLGSALFMVVSIFGFSDILNQQHVILDPSRVAAQVASGIGFIGAGTIILRREVVKGLTTAASIWAAAAMSLATTSSFSRVRPTRNTLAPSRANARATAPPIDPPAP